MFARVKLVTGIADEQADSTLAFSFNCGATTNATQVKRSAGVIVAIHAINVNAAVRYLKFYDMNTAPSAGVGAPVRRFGIPGNAAGAGFILQPIVPMRFLSGIAFTLVTGAADTDATATTANDVTLTIEYV